MMGDVARQKEFDNIYLSLPLQTFASGKLKFAEAGVGFKEHDSSKITTVAAGDMKRVQWVRVARDYQLRITKKDRSVVKFDGFPRDAMDHLSSLFKSYYQLNVEQQDMALRGWNWGRTDFQQNALAFVVGSKNAFELPLTEIANTTQPSKNEVSIEFVTNQPDKRNRDDTMVELRLYVPGQATVGQVGEATGKSTEEMTAGREDGEVDLALEEPAVNDEGEAITAASLLYETLKERCDLGAVTAGEAVATLNAMLCVTPRGRFEVALYEDFFRLRGKTHDYKINYTTITRLFSLPKPDDMHQMFVIGLEPPLRQGQTRYPFLVFQFEREEEIEVELNMDMERLETHFEGRLKQSYDAPSFEVVPELFRGFSGRKLIMTGGYKTAQNHAGIKCFYKANEAFLYPLDKSIMVVPKPPMYLQHSQISLVTFSRVGGGGSSYAKSFEVRFNMTNGTEFSFSSIPREEYQSLEGYCRAKGLRVDTEMADEGPTYGTYESSDEEVDARATKRARQSREAAGDAEEEESEDEDFVAPQSGSDVDEEFNSDYQSSGEESGAEQPAKE